MSEFDEVVTVGLLIMITVGGEYVIFSVSAYGDHHGENEMYCFKYEEHYLSPSVQVRYWDGRVFEDDKFRSRIHSITAKYIVFQKLLSSNPKENTMDICLENTRLSCRWTGEHIKL